MNGNRWNTNLAWRNGAIWRRRWSCHHFIDHIFSYFSRVMVTFLSIPPIVSPITLVLKYRIWSVMFPYSNPISVASVRPCFVASNRFSTDELWFWSVKTVFVAKKFQLTAKQSKSITWIEGRIFPVYLPN